MTYRGITTIFVLLALAASGCTTYAEVPRDQFTDVSQAPSGLYRIRMKTNAEYVTSWFSITDSTLVVSKLSPADGQYRLARLPIAVRLDDVESIALVESSTTAPIVVVGVIGTMITLTAGWFLGWYE